MGPETGCRHSGGLGAPAGQPRRKKGAPGRPITNVDGLQKRGASVVQTRAAAHRLLTLCPAALEAGAAALPEAARLEPMPPSVLVCAICNRGSP